MPVINVKRFSRSKVDAAPPTAPAPAPEPTPVEYESDHECEAPPSTPEAAAGDDADFSDLTRSAFEATQREAASAETRAASEKERAKEDAKIEKEMAKKVAELEKRASKQQKKPAAAQPKRATAAVDDSDSVFGETGSEILGRDKRQLITKITQYRQLFPKELKGFKVKKNASTQELKAYLDEMACIVETGTLDEFITDSILASLKMVEGLSSYTKNCNISGLADMLKMNPQFNSLVKQLYIKYNTFDNVPPENQLLILVITTSYVCIQKNKNKSKLEAFLNEPVSFAADKTAL